MRIVAMVAVFLMLAGCEQMPSQIASAAGASADPAASLGSSSAFDYRYAFRMPASRIASAQESHARGCDQLGPAHCRITAIRYNVDDQHRVEAALTLNLDPTIARAYGKAATDTVTRAGGSMTKADMAGSDAAAGRSDRVIERLREALGITEAQLRATASPEQSMQLSAKADRLRSAIATIGEVDQGTGTAVATTPVILTYASGGAGGGLGSSDATFDTAGQTLLSSLAGLATILAGVGPWLLLLLGGALILRRVVQGPADQAPVPAPIVPPAPRGSGEDRNVIQRWFTHDDQRERETVD